MVLVSCALVSCALVRGVMSREIYRGFEASVGHAGASNGVADMLRKQLEECLWSGSIQVSQVFSQGSWGAVSDLDGRELKRLRGVQEFDDVRMWIIREDPILKRSKFKFQGYNLGFQGFDAIFKVFHSDRRLSGGAVIISGGA